VPAPLPRPGRGALPARRSGDQAHPPTPPTAPRQTVEDRVRLRHHQPDRV
ncbi:MAG: hypothetical protein AVDCRST_MAG66-2814, partial [uncultured Pseudonocardia sp.]